ncbi:MAG: chaperonin GroEL [Planctomycetota bacterium]|nr:chaperonin GroEL [Planctomycetota bacterium]
MGAKRVLMYEDARKELASGVSLAARALKVTYGPKGKNVIMQRPWGAPRITRDGFAVAKEMEVEGKERNLGIQLIKDVVEKTHKEAGDGTTTATILTEALFVGGLKLVGAGYDPMGIARGMEIGYEDAIKQIDKNKKAMKGRESVAYVATVACGGDKELGDWVARAVEKAGESGLIVVEEGKSTATTLRVIEGMVFDRGYISPYFINKAENRECVLEDALVLTYEKRIGNVEEFLPLLEKAVHSGKPLLIISEDVEGEALATLVVNNLQGTLRCCAVKAPGYGERRKRNLEDIAIVVGGRAILEETGVKLSEVELSDLGKVKKAVITKEETMLIGGAGERKAVEARAEQIREEIKTTESDYDREQLEKRLARLAGGVIEIGVGGATEVEMKYKKSVLEGGIKAVQAAKLDGIVPGGGVVFIRAAQGMKKQSFLNESEAVGYKLVRDSLEAPIRHLVENAGLDPSPVLERVKKGKGAFGYDIEKGEFTDLFKSGVIDATLVTKVALRNSVSMATMLLTSEATVTEIEKKAKEKAKYPGMDEMPEDMDEY